MIYNTTELWFGLRVDLIVGFFSGIVIFTSILLNDSAGEFKLKSHPLQEMTVEKLGKPCQPVLSQAF